MKEHFSKTVIRAVEHLQREDVQKNMRVVSEGWYSDGWGGVGVFNEVIYQDGRWLIPASLVIDIDAKIQL